jgi:hypothetical protein
VASPLSAASIDVKPVVLPGTATGEPAGTMTFSIAPQSMNLRNALDAWLQTLGWQLAWKIDDDLPVEFNATFSGDFRPCSRRSWKRPTICARPRVSASTPTTSSGDARAANCKD